MTDRTMLLSESGKAVLSLVCGTPKPYSRLLLMLTAFLDDSGSEGLGPVFVLAGYLAPAESWLVFTEDWRTALEAKPRIDYFKMKEANSRRKQFSGWSESDRDEKVAALVAIILKHVKLGITSTFWWEDFRTVQLEFPDLNLNAYDLLFHGGVAVTAHYLLKDKHTKGPVDFVFDEQGQAGVRAALSYDWVKRFFTKEETEVLGGRPVQRDEKLFLPLQAADLIAWQTRRYVADNEDALINQSPPSFQRLSESMKKLETIPTLHNVYSLERLRSLGHDFRALQAQFPDEASFLSGYGNDLPFKRKHAIIKP